MSDVGILVFDNIIPEEHFKSLTLKDLNFTDQSLEELEKDYFRIDHSEAVTMFMAKWWAISDKVNSELVRQGHLETWLKCKVCEVEAQS
jgi:hypothetical protein